MPKLRKQHLELQTFRAKGAIAANRVLAYDTVNDATGGLVKQVAALADKIAGVSEDAADDGQLIGVAQKGIVPLVCADASIATGVLVYNDAVGKVSGTQGAGATLIGITESNTTAADQLVPVRLQL